MSEIKAGIIALTNFVKPGNKVFSGMIDYIDRDEAVRKDNIEKFNLYFQHLEYTDNPVKTIKRQNEGLKELSSLFTKEKNYLSLDEKDLLKESFILAQKNESLLWQTVISFDNRYLELQKMYDKDLGILDDEKIKNATRKAMSNLLLKEGLENAIWAGNIHYNTDNIHIHISTVEINPSRKKEKFYQYETIRGKYKLRTNELTGKKERIPILDSDGNHIYKEEYRGKFKASSLENFKSTFISEIDISKEQNIEITCIMRNMIDLSKKQSILKEKELEPKIKYLYEALKEKEAKVNLKRHEWTYGRNALADLRPVIDSITNEYIDKNFIEEFNKLNKLLSERKEFYNLTYGDTGKDYMKNALDDFKKRMGNTLLKELANFDKEIETENIKKEYSISDSNKKENYLNISDGAYDIRKAMYKIKKSMEKEKENYLNQYDYMILEQEMGLEI